LCSNFSRLWVSCWVHCIWNGSWKQNVLYSWLGVIAQVLKWSICSVGNLYYLEALLCIRPLVIGVAGIAEIDGTRFLECGVLDCKRLTSFVWTMKPHCNLTCTYGITYAFLFLINWFLAFPKKKNIASKFKASISQINSRHH
jgi:hypothetical protein